MKPLLILSLIALSVSACTIEQQGGELQSEFRPPLTYPEWEIEEYKTQSGQPVCVVCSGYGGLSIAQRRDAGGNIEVSAMAERKLTPGMEFSINVNGNHYRTSQEYFSARESMRLADDLSTDGKAYLEWSEPHGNDHNRLRTSNILKLDGFKQQFDQCRQALK